MLKKVFILIISLVSVLISCTKEEDDSPVTQKTEIKFLVRHDVNGDTLIFNNLTDKRYENAAGNFYEVTRLEYYLSDFKLQRINGQWHSPSNEPVLINAENGSFDLTLNGVEIGEYKALSFLIGIPATKNKSGMLENNLANLNMAWPESLGGGYHFLKFEGNYFDLNDIIRGFTVHLGGEGMQAVCTMDVSLTVSTLIHRKIEMSMNLNQWFESPHLFDFNVDGSYTMAVDSLMEKISENGNNCFTINSIK